MTRAGLVTTSSLQTNDINDHQSEKRQTSPTHTFRFARNTTAQHPQPAALAAAAAGGGDIDLITMPAMKTVNIAQAAKRDHAAPSSE